MKVLVGDKVRILQHELVEPMLYGTHGKVNAIVGSLKTGEVLTVEYLEGPLVGIEGRLPSTAVHPVSPDCDCDAMKLGAPYHSNDCAVKVWMSRHKK